MVDTVTITSASDLRSAIGSKEYKAGDTASITYIREGKVYTTSVTFGSTTEMPQTEPKAESNPQQGNYDDYYGYGNGGYGSMEDFFNQFFGGYLPQAA